MKLFALTFRLLLLTSNDITSAIFTKWDITHCKPYFDAYSQVYEMTFNQINLCFLQCHNMGKVCPFFEYDAPNKLCRLSVLNSARAIPKSVQFFTSNFVHKVSIASPSPSPPFISRRCVCVSGRELLAADTTSRVRFCELQPQLD